jgi:filamentous hemagglutinin
MVIMDKTGKSVSLAETIGGFENGIRPSGVNALEISKVISNAGIENKVNLSMLPGELDQVLSNGQQVIINLNSHFIIVDSKATVNGSVYYMTRDPSAGSRGVLSSIVDSAWLRSGGNAIVIGK